VLDQLDVVHNAASADGQPFNMQSPGFFLEVITGNDATSETEHLKYKPVISTAIDKSSPVVISTKPDSTVLTQNVVYALSGYDPETDMLVSTSVNGS